MLHIHVPTHTQINQIDLKENKHTHRNIKESDVAFRTQQKARIFDRKIEVIVPKSASINNM